MRTLESVVASPSGFDTLANYVGQSQFPGWDCLLTQTRDSGCLERSGESDDVAVHRFGHWACGWWEALAVKQGTPAHALATSIADRLEDYPVVDEEHFSQTEQEDADVIWRDCYRPVERLSYIREHRRQFEFHDWRDVRSCVRGDYFAGYASELAQ